MAKYYRYYKHFAIYYFLTLAELLQHLYCRREILVEQNFVVW